MNNDMAIKIQGLYKRYGLPPFRPWAKNTLATEACALRDINLDLKKGDSLGILGKNGAGKSTLLKLLAGVTLPDKGHLQVNGSVFPMIELSAGISMELTGRENINLLGTIMGFSAGKLKEITPQIIEFSELGHWIDRPVWQYSSGMQARLAFGLAVHAEADILLVDEVLAVGDIQFQKKSFKKMQALLASGITLVLVTHSPYQVERLCNKAIIMEQGEIISCGESTLISKEYIAMTSYRSGGGGTGDGRNLLHIGTGDIIFTECHFEDNSGKRIEGNLSTGEDVYLVFEYEATERVEAPDIICRITDEYQRIIATLAPNREEYKKLVIDEGKGTIRCFLPGFSLIGSQMSISIKCSAGLLIDSVEDILTFTSEQGPKTADRSSLSGVTYVPSHWHYSALDKA